MIRNLFRWNLRPVPLTDDAPDVMAEFFVRMEETRRRQAFDRAVAEFQRPDLTTEDILDLYLTAVA